MPDEKRTPGYKLGYIQRMISLGYVHINDNAERDAENDFGWGSSDIRAALLKLKPSHFYKSEPYDGRPDVKMDYYKAKKLHQNFDVYTHFYVRKYDVVVVISSLKKL